VETPLDVFEYPVPEVLSSSPKRPKKAVAAPEGN